MMRLPPSLPSTNPLDIFEIWSERRVGRKPLHVVGPKPVTLAQLSLRLYRLLELLGNLERLLTICVLRCNPSTACHFHHGNKLSKTAIPDVSKCSPPNNKTNNIQLHPGISTTAYSL